MIKNLSLNDKTQKNILEHLKITEQLLQLASGSDVEITLMADGCPAHNVTRMLDGHFTGTVTKILDPKEPFVPVGTTVNVCGVVIYKLRHEISMEDFKSRVYSAMDASPKPYTWNNFNRGNHFVSLMYSDGKTGLPTGQYLVVHASANEYRNQLYPNKGVWYEDQLKRVTHPDIPNRSLHYITGITAEKFYDIAKNLINFNKMRNTSFCEVVLNGGIADREILNVQHYGMPDANTICIGVQWETDGIVPLLTAPGKNIYLVKPAEGTKYFPHGFGLEIHEGDIHYTSDGGVCIGTKILYPQNSVTIGGDAFNRADRTPVELCVKRVLDKNPATIVAELKQIASMSARGFEVWND